MMKKYLGVLAFVFGFLSASFAAAGYCTPSVLFGPSGEIDIRRVLLTGSNGTLDNASTSSTNSPTYNDYFSSAFVPVLISGEQYTVSITVGPHSYPDHMNVAAWIDFDGDQTFSPGEKIGQTDAMGNDATTSFLFTGTATAARLRVMIFHLESSFDPCYIGSNVGESEDYDLNARYAAPMAGGETRRVIPVDNCPVGDMSPTPYDGLCAGMSAMNGGVLASTGLTSSSTTGSLTVSGSITTTSSGSTMSGTQTTGELVVVTTGSEQTNSEWIDADTCVDAELEGAYMFARAHSITTMETCKKARMEETLLRRDAAKMMVNFAINILGKKADRTRKCEFTDLAGLTTEEQNYIKTACELGLMGLNGDGTPAALFNPALPVDKVQFAVTLSRMLYGTTNNTTDACWYCKHIDALYDAKILTTKTALFAPFIRGWAMLMLQRVK